MRYFLAVLLTVWASLAGVLDKPAPPTTAWSRSLLANSTASGALSTLGIGNFTASASGLTLTIGPGVYKDAFGIEYAYAGGTISLINPASMSFPSTTYTNHVYLLNGSLYGCSRAIHRGGVYIGAFVSSSAGGGSITGIYQPTTFELKPSRLYRWLSQQNNGNPARVWAIGDSITEGSQATGSPLASWYNLLFNSSLSGSGYNVPNIANVTGLNFGNSGSSSIWCAAMTGDLITQSKNPNSVGAINQVAHHRTAYNNALDIVNFKKIGTAYHYRSLPDLAIVGCGNTPQWAGDYASVQFETAIRRLRWRGIDVLMHTEQPFYTSSATNATINNWTLLQDASRMQQIADAAGADIADTFGFMQWLRDSGAISTYYYSDNTHPNNAGHAVWAAVIRSCVAPTERVSYSVITPAARTQRYSGTVNNQVASGIDLYFDYTNGNGTTTTDTQNGSKNINTVATGASTSANCHSLAATQKILVTHGGCLTVSVISALGPGTTAVCHFENNGGSTIGSSFTITGSYGQAITPIWKQSDFVGLTMGTEWPMDNSAAPNRFPVYPLQLWLKVDSFTGGATALPVIGFVFETPIRTSIPNEACNFYGTWATESHSNYHEDGLSLKYTDTANSGFVVPFDGDVLECWLPLGSQFGTAFTISVDGDSVVLSGSIASPSGGGYVRHLWLQPWNSTRSVATQLGYSQPPRNHFANVKLITAGSAPVAGNRSLVVMALNSLKFD